MKIQVTDADIKNGIPSSAHCPIAKAMDRQGFRGVMVGRIFIACIPPNESKLKWIDLPVVAREFISKFDCKLPVTPIEFEISDS